MLEGGSKRPNFEEKRQSRSFFWGWDLDETSSGNAKKRQTFFSPKVCKSDAESAFVGGVAERTCFSAGIRMALR